MAFTGGSHLRVIVDPPLKNKPAPEYKYIDPELAGFVDEYKSLANDRGIKFTNTVTIGFKEINHGDVVGICNYGKDFREIDIDINYWETITALQKKGLIFHELSHCYCLRKHDYDEDRPYPESKTSFVKSRPPPFFFISAGFFLDGCPVSIMYPYVMGDSCMEEHEKDYNYEMLNRCSPF